MDAGDFGKFFRLFLGLPTHRPPRSNSPYEPDDGEPFPPNEDPSREQGMRGEGRDRRHFTVLTDPLEIHRFFEQQMDDMLRNFGQGFGGFGGAGRETGRGAITLEPQEEEVSGSVRDFMLKDEGQPRVDTDLDSKQVDMGELETLMGRKENRSGEEECGRGVGDLFGGLLGRGGFFDGATGGNTFLGTFGTSVVERSVSTPGGGVETSKTVRNSDGTEVITVTRQMGDQVHQQTTTKSRDGSTTTEHRLTNGEEGGLEIFDNRWRGQTREEEGGRWQVQPSPREEMMGPPGDQLYNSLRDKFWGN
eukprot:GFUD01022318.1.p1 GENE.GFUD01022318.1~~GFUD01022318.1.p1  ORF type:complete len:305 (+),score=117.59 GFUD01022318.1:371-1285(+)